MQTIAVVARKGGVSKTTLCINLAVQALQVNIRSAIIDADSQKTAALWRDRREHAAPAVSTGNIQEALDVFRRAGAELVFIDLPPFSLPLINQAIEQADACLIPTSPFPFDLEQVGPIASICSSLNKKAAIVLTKCPTRSAAVDLARGALAAFGLPITPGISNLVAFPYAAASGEAVCEWEPEGKAAAEIQRLWTWLIAKGFVHE